MAQENAKQVGATLRQYYTEKCSFFPCNVLFPSRGEGIDDDDGDDDDDNDDDDGDDDDDDDKS